MSISYVVLLTWYFSSFSCLSHNSKDRIASSTFNGSMVDFILSFVIVECFFFVASSALINSLINRCLLVKDSLILYESSLTCLKNLMSSDMKLALFIKSTSLNIKENLVNFFQTLAMSLDASISAISPNRLMNSLV